MAQTKKLDQERWSEFLSMLSSGNRGRMIAIEVESMAIGAQPIAVALPLFAIDYDSVNKGDDLVISTGLDSVDYSHTISSPTEIWELQDDNGKVSALEIIDHTGAKTIIVFKS